MSLQSLFVFMSRFFFASRRASECNLSSFHGTFYSYYEMKCEKEKVLSKCPFEGSRSRAFTEIYRRNEKKKSQRYHLSKIG
ncbi:MAG: hypothetical protein BYD32DRAFT_429939 [Podila humilis]|nr:MAG: hypothetical protein BYD32DRAFT_429939 [Podila humilis]